MTKIEPYREIRTSGRFQQAIKTLPVSKAARQQQDRAPAIVGFPAPYKRNGSFDGELAMDREQGLPRNEQIDSKMLDEREANLLEEIRNTRHYYSKSAREARLFHNAITIIVLIGSVIAPIAVVSSTGTQAGLALFGINEKFIAQTAVVVTVILSLCEGLRRSFQFDMRWTTCVQAREQLGQLCDIYPDGKVGFARDDAERHKKLEDLRQKTYEIRAQEEAGFFKRLTARIEGERRQ